MNSFEDYTEVPPSSAEASGTEDRLRGRLFKGTETDSGTPWGRRSGPEIGVSPFGGCGPEGGAFRGPNPGTRARNRPIETAIIERYRRRDGTVEETMLEIHQAGISMQRAEAVARLLWGPDVNAATVSDFSRRIAIRIDNWRHRPIRGRHFYVFLGAIDLQSRWGGAKHEVRVLVAVGVNAQGFREVLGVADTGDPAADGWRRFLGELEMRGLNGVQLVVSAADPAIAAAAARSFPAATRQICTWQLQRDLLASVGSAQVPGTAALLKEIFESNTPAMARDRARTAVAQLREMDLSGVAQRVEQNLDSALRFLTFPHPHWRNLRTNFVLMKVLRQIRERTRLVGAFSDGEGAVLMVSARLRFVADQWSASRRPWDMSSLTTTTDAVGAQAPFSEATRVSGRH